MNRAVRHLAILSAALLSLCACATAGGPSPGQRVNFVSYDPEDYAAIIDGSYRQTSARIHGYLSIPAGASGKVPAVVIIPGSGGYFDWMFTNIAQPLNEAEIATFIVDSFTGRGVTETSTDQGRVSMAASIMDGFSALKLLADRPEIDPERIGITGFSRGGVASMFTLESRLQNAVFPTGPRFAAHVPFYPGCSTQWQQPLPTKAPILFLLGGKDDMTPAPICTRYAERLKAAGARVDYKIYPDAYHAWVSNFRPVKVNALTFGNCDLQIRPDGIIIDAKTGADSSKGWRAFADEVTRTCAGRGAMVGENPEARRQAVADMVSFFRTALQR